MKYPRPIVCFLTLLFTFQINCLSAKNGSNELADSLRAYGLYLKKSGDFVQAIEHYKSALKIYKKQQSLIDIANCQNKLGVVYFRISEYDKALGYYYQSLSINDSLNNSRGLLNNYINLGNFFTNKHDYKSGMGYYKSALQISKELGQVSKQALIYNNMGSLYSHIDKKNDFVNIDSAYHYYNLAYLIYIDHNARYEMAGSLQNFGLVKEMKDELDSALYFYEKSLKLKTKLGLPQESIVLCQNTGNIYFKKQQFEKAIDYYIQGIGIARQYSLANFSQELSLNISKSYESLTKIDSAHKYYKQHIIFKDSVFNETKSQQIAELQTKYETEKKEQRIVFQQTEIKQKTSQRDTYLITLVIALSLTIGLVFIYQQRQKAIAQLRDKEKSLYNQNVDDLLKDQEIKSLNAMMSGQEKERKRIAEDLHDRLGSKLAAVKLHYGASAKKVGTDASFKKAAGILDETIEETRKIAHNLLSGVLTKFGLMAALDDLKNTIEGTNEITFELNISNIENRLPNDLEINIYRIIQELISNMLKHAQAKNISIQLTKHADHSLTLMVEDDGVGFNTAEKGEGIGLQNMQARAERFDGEVAIDSTIGHGTTVTVNMQIPQS